MEIKLSPRLSACCSFVSPGAIVADVGCDHGYVSIYLLQNGLAKQVYACDIKEGPLTSARHNAVKYGVSENIRFFLADGLVGVPRDFNTLLIAGMGADVMVSILSASPWLENGQYRMILQCQSRTPVLRRYLSDNGWKINEELVLKDGRFLYTVMEVSRGENPLTASQCWLPDNLTGEVDTYRTQVLKHLALSAQGQPDLAEILQELQKENKS